MEWMKQHVTAIATHIVVEGGIAAWVTQRKSHPFTFSPSNYKQILLFITQQKVCMRSLHMSLGTSFSIVYWERRKDLPVVDHEGGVGETCFTEQECFPSLIHSTSWEDH